MMYFSSHHDLLPAVISLLLCLIPLTDALGVSFTAPGAGSTWPAGPITVTWQDAGGNPDMSHLSTYALHLVIGGNSAGNSKVIATLGSAGANVSDGQAKGTISANIAESVENGFYWRMLSNTTNGNQVINYSARVTLISMNGTTDSIYLDGANSARGADDVPEAQYNVLNNPSSTTVGSITTTAASTATTTITPSSSGSGSSSDKPLGTGITVAIGVAAFLALVGFASLFGWAYVLYRHKKRKQEEEVVGFAKGLNNGKAQSLDDIRNIPVELSSADEIHEAHGFDTPVEAARASIYELEGEWEGWEAGTGRRSYQQRHYDPTL